MNEAPVIRVLTVDDHPLMMAGIAGEINAQPDMRVVAEATDGSEGIARFREHRPDVTLMDIRMPNVNGLDAVSAIMREFPTARIVILTTVGGDVQALRAFKAGAAGYLLKNMLRKDLSTPYALFTQEKDVFRQKSPRSWPNILWMTLLRRGKSMFFAGWLGVIRTAESPLN